MLLRQKSRQRSLRRPPPHENPPPSRSRLLHRSGLLVPDYGAVRAFRSATGRATASSKGSIADCAAGRAHGSEVRFQRRPRQARIHAGRPDGRLHGRCRLRLRTRRAGRHRRQRQHHHQRQALSVLRQSSGGQLQRDGDFWRLRRRDHYDHQGGVGPPDAGARRGSRRPGGRAHIYHQCPHAASAQAAHQRHRTRRGEPRPVRPQQFARLGRQTDC